MKRENQRLQSDFYEGNADAIFRHFIARRVSGGVRADERISINDFYFQNDIRVIQDTRVSFMPKTFDVFVSRREESGPNEPITNRVREWLDSRNFGGGRTFWEAFPGLCLTQENCGTVFLKLFVKDGGVSVQKMYSDDVDVIVDEKNYLDVLKYVFSWGERIDLEGGGSRVVKMTEEINDKSFTITADGRLVKSEEHRFGFVPVVRILREEVEGSPYGRSGIEDLIEAQQNVNMALTKRAWATKYNSFRVWAPKEAGYIESGTTIRISPGALSPIPIEAVGGDVDLSAVERELDDALDHLYRLGSVSRRLKDDMLRASTSAKALNSMLEWLKRYTERKLVYMRRGLEEMILKYLKIAYNRDDFKVTISFPSLDREDPEHTLNRARFLAERGMEAEALKEIGFEKEIAEEGAVKK
ncbi:MAG: phage portal protein [Deltaproteobacteria bacterium]|uniref:Phage portal protein n=1 Tax=Candidatus Zymogenus saltonus TaxID=2844893 RepID=A0A9D8KFA7_9DELT|nr:phage portal protein [Candidatus Zymogenus saltonus]